MTPGRHRFIPVETRIVPATRELLEHFSREELRDYARYFGLPQGGTKREIIERLVANGNATVLASLGNDR